ncbi:MAG: hypothetical protein ACOCTL_02365 [Candidatus Hadarchaeota archaeon]
MSVEIENNIKRLIAFSAVAIMGVALFLLFTRNLSFPDYPYHLHEMWVATKGNFIRSPYLAGGAQPIYQYGLPVNVMGLAVFPIFGEYSVAILTAAGLPFLWLSAKKVFENFFDDKTAKISAFIVLLNPLIFRVVLAPTLPFLWATVFGLFGIHFYFSGRQKTAIFLSLIAIITHPLTAVLFASVLLLDPAPRKWIKTFSAPLVVSIIQLSVFFGLFQSILTGQSVINSYFFYNIPILFIVLLIAYKVKENARMYTLFGMIVFSIWVALGYFGFWMPAGYMDRVALFITILLTPFILRFAVNELNQIQFRMPSIGLPRKRLVVIPIAMILLAFSGLYTQAELGTQNETVDMENENRRKELVEIIENKRVYYANRGQELYELPRYENVIFSNTGKFQHDDPPENEPTFTEKLEEQEASFVLVHGENPVEDTVENLNFPLVYTKENLRLYEVVIENLDNSK